MLPVAIASLVLGLLATGAGTTVGGGAIIFAAGFFVISAIALLSNWRGHPAV